MPRLFVAIDPPEAVKEQLGSLCFGIPGAKWVPPDQLHLTIRFIGDTEGGLFHDIREALAEIRQQPFPLRPKGVGHFPPRKEPRVLWVGLEASQPLILLRNKVENTLNALGVAREGRKFSPHITLARLKNASIHKVGKFLAGNGLYALEPFEVREFRLYSSRLTPKGAIHTIEAAYPLKD